MKTGVVIGAGDRGADAYTPFLLENPEVGRIVAVAEPNAVRRERFARSYEIAPERCFADWQALLAEPRLADFALIATPDALHEAPAIAALERGYHVLLEKPMAVTEAACERLAAKSEETGRLLQVCHVLRHASLFEAIQAVVDSGDLGRIVTIQHSENVSYWHYAHSYARGHWRNATDSSPMILAKSCHDLDLLYALAGAPPVRLTSIARPTELVAENAPEGAPEFCAEGCAHAAVCPYDAVAMYRHATPLLLDASRRTGQTRDGEAPPSFDGVWPFWPTNVFVDEPTPEGIDRALRESRYGRCVYRVGDNDQPSSQTVGVLFANGVNASFTLHSTSHREGRETRIDGTLGSLTAGFYVGEQWLEVTRHKTGEVRRVPLPAVSARHGGADPRLFADFLAALEGERAPRTTAAESLWSHRMAFAADRAAREGVVVRWEDPG